MCARRAQRAGDSAAASQPSAHHVEHPLAGIAEPFQSFAVPKGPRAPRAFDKAIVFILGLLTSRELSGQPDERSEAISIRLRPNVIGIAVPLLRVPPTESA